MGEEDKRPRQEGGSLINMILEVTADSHSEHNNNHK